MNLRSIALSMACGVATNSYGLIVLAYRNYNRDFQLHDSSEVLKTINELQQKSVIDVVAITLMPFVEELAYRYFLHIPLRWIANKIVPNKTLEIGIGPCRFQMEQSQLIASIAAGIIFGMVHSDRDYYAQIRIGISGIVTGIVYEKWGFIPAVIKHATHNAVVEIVSYYSAQWLLKKFGEIAKTRGLDIPNNWPPKVINFKI